LEFQYKRPGVNNIIKGFLGGFFKRIVLLLNKILKAVLSVCFKLSIVLIAYSMLLLSSKANKEGKGFIWPEKGSFKAGRKKKV
jgi:hypothetical protein